MSTPESVTPKWKSLLIVVCEKCGKKIDSRHNPADEIKTALKQKIKTDEKNARAITGSCLDVCPVNKIAVAILKENETPTVMLVEGSSPSTACEQILQTAFQNSTSPSQ